MTVGSFVTADNTPASDLVYIKAPSYLRPAETKTDFLTVRLYKQAPSTPRLLELTLYKHRSGWGGLVAGI